MANNTLIFQIVVDFPFSACFCDFGGGHSASKCSQVLTFPNFWLGGGGVIPFQKVPKLKKVPSWVGGGEVISTWELFPSFGAF